MTIEIAHVLFSRMSVLVLLFLISLCSAERFAIIYDTVQRLTNTEVPSVGCRMYDVPYCWEADNA